jgi:hypothetical protein
MAKGLLGSVSLIVMVFAFGAYAADMPFKAPLKAPVVVSDWDIEAGGRYWYSSGRHQFDLSTRNGGPLVSRLTYSDLTGHSAESFWRIEHSSGLFIKGFFGGGSISGGHMIDEDFPPFIAPYSATRQEQKDGQLRYLSADLGYDFWNGPVWRLGGFVGYHYWNEELNTFGCTQFAGNQGICGTIPPAFGPIPTGMSIPSTTSTFGIRHESARMRRSTLPRI